MAPAILKTLAAGLLGITLLSGGCAMNKTGQAREVTRTLTSMQSTRQELGKFQAQIDNVLAALDQLSSASAAGLPKTYKAFTKQVSRTVSQAETVQRRADQMRERWQDYITSWEKESEQFSTPELRARAAERLQAVRQNYDRLREATRALEKAYQPFLAQLKDIQTSLALDLTPAGVKAAQPAFENARQGAADVRQQSASFTAAIDQVLAVSPPSK